MNITIAICVCQIACLAIPVSFRTRLQVSLIGQNQDSIKSYCFQSDEATEFIGTESKKLQIFLCSDPDKLPLFTTESPKLLIRVMASDDDSKSASKQDSIELGRLEIDPGMVWTLFEELNDEAIVLPIIGRSQTMRTTTMEPKAGLELEVVGALVLGCKALGNFQSLNGRPLQVDEEPVNSQQVFLGKQEPGLFDAVKDRDEFSLLIVWIVLVPDFIPTHKFSILVRNGMTGFEYQSKDTNNPYDSQGMANRMEFYSAADSAPKDKWVSKHALGPANPQIGRFDFKKSALNAWISSKIKSDEKLRTLFHS